MKQFWVLYWKEMKSSKIIFLFLIIASRSMGGYSHFLSLGPKIESKMLIYKLYVENFSLATLLILPLTFFYLITQHRNRNIKYQLFSLPIRRRLIILPHFFVIMSYAIIIPLVMILLSAIFTAYDRLFLDKLPRP